jgi:hypothetical protein
MFSEIRPDFEVVREGRILHLTVNTKPKKIGWSYKKVRPNFLSLHVAENS